jgi:DNA-binding IclR family transcriptional regulator
LSQTVRAVERALDILLCFSRQTPELTLTQIAEQVGINKSTVHRLLATLEQKHFVDRDPVTGVYRLGVYLFQMAYLTVEYNDLRRVAGPCLQLLCEKHLETVTLAELDCADLIYLDVVESPQRVKLAAATGQKLPAFCTASGKAILAFSSNKLVESILASGMPQYTPFTIISPDAFHVDLELTRERGFAISVQEFEEGINAVAAPILNNNNQAIASIAIAGPSYRLTPERMVEMGPLVLDAAREVASKAWPTMEP